MRKGRRGAARCYPKSFKLLSLSTGLFRITTDQQIEIDPCTHFLEI